MIRAVSGLEPPPLLKVSIWGFTPQTSASDVVARKTDLRDRIRSEIRDLPSVRNNCRNKRLSLDVCFRLLGATAESGRKDKDLVRGHVPCFHRHEFATACSFLRLTLRGR